MAAAVQTTAERIIDAAVELFADRGFDGVSVRDIAEHAGVNKALVFYHHENKGKLLEKVFARYYLRYTQTLADVVERRGTMQERVHALLDANLDFIEENLAYVRLVQLEIAFGSEHMEHIRFGLTVLYEAFEKVLRDQAPATGPLAARHLFISFSGMINMYFLQARALEPLWGDDPLRVKHLRERRAHLHWMIDAVLTSLEHTLGEA